MLVVATFSLGTVVQAFASAANQATPRAARVLIDDPYSQNVLATFLGAFVFAMVGLVALGFGYYSRQGKTVLLVSAGLVILIVMATFFAWLDHLANMVRLGETIRKVEVRADTASSRPAPRRRASAAAPDHRNRPRRPRGRRASTRSMSCMSTSRPCRRSPSGAAAASPSAALPGALSGPTRPLALDRLDARRRRDRRSPPRLFLRHRALARPGPALLPAGALPKSARGRSPRASTTPARPSPSSPPSSALLTLWAETAREAAASREPVRAASRTSLPRPSTPADLCEDAFGPLLRDGAPIVEVGLRLQKTLAVPRRPARTGLRRAGASRSRDCALVHAGIAPAGSGGPRPPRRRGDALSRRAGGMNPLRGIGLKVARRPALRR